MRFTNKFKQTRLSLLIVPGRHGEEKVKKKERKKNRKEEEKKKERARPICREEMTREVMPPPETMWDRAPD